MPIRWKEQCKDFLHTFDFVTLKNLPKCLEQLLEVFGGTHPTQVTHKHFCGVQRPSPRLFHHQIPTAKLPPIELPDGSLGSSLALQVHKGELPQHAAADHLAVGFKDGRQLLLGGVQSQVAHEELHCVALIHGAAEKQLVRDVIVAGSPPQHIFGALTDGNITRLHIFTRFDRNGYNPVPLPH